MKQKTLELCNSNQNSEVIKVRDESTLMVNWQLNGLQQHQRDTTHKKTEIICNHTKYISLCWCTFGCY